MVGADRCKKMVTLSRVWQFLSHFKEGLHETSEILTSKGLGSKCSGLGLKDVDLFETQCSVVWWLMNLSLPEVASDLDTWSVGASRCGRWLRCIQQPDADIGEWLQLTHSATMSTNDVTGCSRRHNQLHVQLIVVDVWTWWQPAYHVQQNAVASLQAPHSTHNHLAHLSWPIYIHTVRLNTYITDTASLWSYC